jgi:hypothetical protein
MAGLNTIVQRPFRWALFFCEKMDFMMALSGGMWYIEFEESGDV